MLPEQPVSPEQPVKQAPVERMTREQLQPRPRPMERLARLPILILGTVLLLGLAWWGMLSTPTSPPPPPRTGEGPAQGSVNRSLRDASLFNTRVALAERRFPSRGPEAREAVAPSSSPAPPPSVAPRATPVIVPEFTFEPSALERGAEPTVGAGSWPDRQQSGRRESGRPVPERPAPEALLEKVLAAGLAFSPATGPPPGEGAGGASGAASFLGAVEARRWAPYALHGEATPPRTLRQGTLLPVVLETEINSDLPGGIRARLSRDVLDSSGRVVLVPRGSAVYGVYDEQVIYGARRLLVAFHRLVLPDGTSFSLPPQGGSDGLGAAGLRDQVRTSFVRMLRSALMLSVISAAAENARGGVSGPANAGLLGQGLARDFTDSASAAVGREFQQVATELLRRDLNVAPTLRIRPGYLFHLMLDRDLLFPPLAS